MSLFSVKDFSGGITDLIEDAPTKYADEMDNLLIDPNGKLYSRDGSRRLFSGAPKTATQNRIDSFIVFKGNQNVTNFAGAGDLFTLVPTNTEVKGYRINDTGDGYAELTGYAGSTGVLNGTTSCQTSHAQWRGHLYLTNDAVFLNSSDDTLVAKIFKDSGGTYRVIPAGLPEIQNTGGVGNVSDIAGTFVSEAAAEAALVASVNDLRTKLLSHFGTAGTVHNAADVTASALITAAACTDLATAKSLLLQLLEAYSIHNKDAEVIGAATYHFYHYLETNRFSVRYSLDSIYKPTTMEDAYALTKDLANKFQKHLLDIDNVAPFTSPHKTYDAVNAPAAVNYFFRLPAVEHINLTKEHPICKYCDQLTIKFNLHTQTAARHITGLPVPQTIFNPTNLSELISAINQLILGYGGHIADAELAAGWLYHNAKEAANWHLSGYGSYPAISGYFPTLLRDDATLAQCAAKLLDITTKYNGHEADTVSHNGVASQYPVTFLPTFNVGNYIYAMCYKYSYTVGNTTHVNRSTPVYVTIEDMLEPNADNPVTVANRLGNPSNFIGNSVIVYDNAAIDIEIYRTTRNGTSFYLVDSYDAANGVSYKDYVPDSDLVTREELYTNGGVVGSDAPPICKFIHIIGDIGYFAHVKDQNSRLSAPLDGTGVLANRILQSVPGSIDSVPRDFYVDIDDDITSLSSISSKLLAFGRANVYRIEGGYDLRGQGSMTYEKISDVTGAINHVGTVQTEDAVFFCGLDGFYMTDGYKVQKLSEHLNSTYASLTSSETKKRRMVGCYDKKNKLIIWTCQANSANSDNDSWIILDLKKPLTTTATFTTASNSEHFNPSAIGFYNNQIIRGDIYGNIIKHDSSYYSDPKLLATTASSVNMIHIPYQYKTPNWSFDTGAVRKFATDLEVVAKNVTPLSLQITSVNDGGRKKYALRQIHFRGNVVWDDASLLWGDNAIEWDQHGYIRERRRFASGHLRFDFKQLIMAPAYTVIVNSDTLGSGVVDATLKTVTIPGPGVWPSDITDFYISFDDDNYDTEFLVTNRNSGSVITYSDATNLSVSGTRKWLLKGYPKDERLYLMEYSIPYDVISNPGSDQNAGSQGANV